MGGKGRTLVYKFIGSKLKAESSKFKAKNDPQTKKYPQITQITQIKYFYRLKTQSKKIIQNRVIMIKH